jgi:hypothetical protein
MMDYRLKKELYLKMPIENTAISLFGFCRTHDWVLTAGFFDFHFFGFDFFAPQSLVSFGKKCTTVS